MVPTVTNTNQVVILASQNRITRWFLYLFFRHRRSWIRIMQWSWNSAFPSPLGCDLQQRLWRKEIRKKWIFRMPIVELSELKWVSNHERCFLRSLDSWFCHAVSCAVNGILYRDWNVWPFLRIQDWAGEQIWSRHWEQYKRTWNVFFIQVTVQVVLCSEYDTSAQVHQMSPPSVPNALMQFSKWSWNIISAVVNCISSLGHIFDFSSYCAVIPWLKLEQRFSV